MGASISSARIHTSKAMSSVVTALKSSYPNVLASSVRHGNVRSQNMHEILDHIASVGRIRITYFGVRLKHQPWHILL